MEVDMGGKYYEVVFEGKYDVICGMLEGFLLGENAEWKWYSGKDSGIETGTLTDIIKKWTSLKIRQQHIILDEEFHNALQNAIKEKVDLRYIKLKYAGPAREIKSCSFKFTANAYAVKYGEEIKSILSKLPSGALIENYNPVETIDKDAEGIELYAPVHDYTYKGEGTVTGEFGDVIAFRKILDDHQLFQVSCVKLNF